MAGQFRNAEISRRALLRAGAGAAGLAALGSVVRPAVAGAAAADDDYHYTTYGYGAYGTYDPANGAPIDGLDLPAGTMLKAGIPADTSFAKVITGSHDYYEIDDGLTSANQVTVFDRYDFKCRVKITTSNPVRFTRCKFEGMQTAPTYTSPPAGSTTPTAKPTAYASVDLTAVRNPVSVAGWDAPSGVTATFYDCEISTIGTSWQLNGVRGHGFQIFRCYLHDCVDCVDVYRLKDDTDKKANVEIDGCFMHNLLWFTVPPEEVYDEHTHNDGVQISGCDGVALKGNNIQAVIKQTQKSGDPSPSPYGLNSTGSCVTFTPSQGDIVHTFLNQNWLDHGSQSITMIPGSGAGGTAYNCRAITITSNRFGTNQQSITKNDGVTAKRAVLIDVACEDPSTGKCSVLNFPESTGADGNCNNVMSDGSQLIVYRIDEVGNHTGG